MRAKCFAWYEFWAVDELREVSLLQITWRGTRNWPFFWIYPFPHLLIYYFHFCTFL